MNFYRVGERYYCVAFWGIGMALGLNFNGDGAADGGKLDRVVKQIDQSASKQAGIGHDEQCGLQTRILELNAFSFSKVSYLFNGVVDQVVK